MKPTRIITDESDLEAFVCKSALQHEALEFLHVQTERSKLRLREQQEALAAREAARARRVLATYGCTLIVVLSWASLWL